MNKREQQRDQVTMVVVLLCGFLLAGCHWLVAQEVLPEQPALVATTQPPASGLRQAPPPSRRHAIRRTRAS